MISEAAIGLPLRLRYNSWISHFVHSFVLNKTTLPAAAAPSLSVCVQRRNCIEIGIWTTYKVGVNLST